MADALAVLAAFWGVAMAIAPVLQIRRMLARRSSEDVSLGFLAVLLVGFVIWLSYGAAIGNVALIIPNVVALLVGIATFGVAWRFRSGLERRD